jgi:hypothetical protein
MNVHIREALRSISSALKYIEVDQSGLEDDYYYPAAKDSADIHRESPIEDENDAGVPFKGIHVNATSDIAIIGVDGNVATFNLSPGCWPYGGIGLVEASTDITGTIVLLY